MSIAMDAGDDTTKDSMSPIILETLASNRNEEKLSPEDLAWVDSCIVKDPELLEQNWESLKKALLEIVDIGAEVLNPSATSCCGPPSVDDIKMFSHSEEAKIANLEGHGGNFAAIPAHEELIEEGNVIPFKKEIGILLQAVENEMPAYHRDPFLRTFKEEEKEGPVVNSGSELDSTTDETRLPTEDIFRVWDLDIPSEEADLAKQLNKALEETSFKSFDDSGAWKDPDEESIDTLIAGLGDLALNDNSSRV